jgi:hypothetical protein
MPKVHVTSESDIPQGWRYVIDIDHDDGSHSTHRLRLAWVDHNHWAGERSIPPSRVAQVLIERLLAARLDEPLPERFDAATARRWVPSIDDELSEEL